MSPKPIHKAALAVATAAILLCTSGCVTDQPTAEPAPSSTDTTTPSEDDKGTENRPGALMLAETSFQGVNGEGRWEDDTLIMSLDGDANEELDASVACGILLSFLQAGEKGRLEFPNGVHDCPAA